MRSCSLPTAVTVATKKFTRTFRWRSCGYFKPGRHSDSRGTSIIMCCPTRRWHLIYSHSLKSIHLRLQHSGWACEAEHWAGTFWFDSRPGDLKAAVSRRKTSEHVPKSVQTTWGPEAASVPSEQRTRSHNHSLMSCYICLQPALIIALLCSQNPGLLCKTTVWLCSVLMNREGTGKGLCCDKVVQPVGKKGKNKSFFFSWVFI